MQSFLRVSEIFSSVQGEGYFSGTPATFVRLQGCNLRCSWCDTKYALDSKKGELMKIEDIMDRIDMDFVVITGGEPLLQEKVSTLIKRLLKKGIFVQIETNGTQQLGFEVSWVTVSPKNYFIHPQLIEEAKISELKYVVDEQFDVSKAFLPENIPIFLQPENNRETMIEKALEIIRILKRRNVRLGLQLQKIIGVR